MPHYAFAILFLLGLLFSSTHQQVSIDVGPGFGGLWSYPSPGVAQWDCIAPVAVIPVDEIIGLSNNQSLVRIRTTDDCAGLHQNQSLVSSTATAQLIIELAGEGHFVDHSIYLPHVDLTIKNSVGAYAASGISFESASVDLNRFSAEDITGYVQFGLSSVRIAQEFRSISDTARYPISLTNSSESVYPDGLFSSFSFFFGSSLEAYKAEITAGEILIGDGSTFNVTSPIVLEGGSRGDTIFNIPSAQVRLQLLNTYSKRLPDGFTPSLFEPADTYFHVDSLVFENGSYIDTRGSLNVEANLVDLSGDLHIVRLRASVSDSVKLRFKEKRQRLLQLPYLVTDKAVIKGKLDSVLSVDENTHVSCHKLTVGQSIQLTNASMSSPYQLDL